MNRGLCAVRRIACGLGVAVLGGLALAACDSPLAPAAPATPIPTPTIGMDTRVAIATNQTATVVAGGATQTAKAAAGAAETVTVIAQTVGAPITQTAVVNDTQAAGKAQTVSAIETSTANAPTATATLPPPTATTRPAPPTAAPTPSYTLLRGPAPFTLEQDTDTLIYNGFTDSPPLADFGAVARFYNPPGFDSGVGWDYGFQFRKTDTGFYAVYVDSSANWYLKYYIASGTRIVPTTIASGAISSDYTRSTGAVNILEVDAQGSVGLFSVNNIRVAKLDLSQSTVSGQIYVATGFLVPNAVKGKVTQVEDFKIYGLH